MSQESWRSANFPEGAARGGLRRVRLVVRAGLPASAGNLVSARRLAAALSALGVESRILAADGLDAEPPPGPGEVVHALHAPGAGLPALRWAPQACHVWTFTGTDLEAGALAAVRAACGAVAACVALHAEAAGDLRRVLGLPAGRVHVIPPGVQLPLAEPAADTGGTVFFLPAGIRPVKNPDLAVAVVAAVRAAGIAACLDVAGPARDPEFHRDFLRRLEDAPFARYLGDLPRSEMPARYARASVVLNTSHLEGLANAVLEAMAAGRPVLATDIPGNRAAIRHGVDGWLAAPSALPAAAVQLAADPALRARLGAAARESVRNRFSVEAEVAAHLRLYAAVCAGRPA